MLLFDFDQGDRRHSRLGAYSHSHSGAKDHEQGVLSNIFEVRGNANAGGNHFPKRKDVGVTCEFTQSADGSALREERTNFEPKQF